MKYWSIEKLEKLENLCYEKIFQYIFKTECYEKSVMGCDGMNKCLLWNVQILIKLKECNKSFNKA